MYSLEEMQNEAAEHEEKIFSSCSNPRRFDPYIPGFDLPIWVETHDDYDEKIRTELDRYVDAVSKSFGAHAHVVSETTNIVQHIKHALQCERSRDTEGAKQHIKAIIKSYSSDRFFISELDDNFAFRGNAGFKKLQSGLSAQASKPLSFSALEMDVMKHKRLYSIFPEVVYLCVLQDAIIFLAFRVFILQRHLTVLGEKQANLMSLV